MKKYVKSSTSYTSDIKRVLQAMRNLQDAIEIAEGEFIAIFRKKAAGKHIVQSMPECRLVPVSHSLFQFI